MIPSKRSLVNVNFFENYFDYMFINHYGTNGAPIPQGNGFDLISPPWQQMVDPATGYPFHANASGPWWSASVEIPKSSDFHGPWVLAWTGDGTEDANWGTWTEVNAATASATVSSGNVNIVTGTQNYVAGQKIKFGTTVGNIIAGTTYVVCASGLTTTNIKIATSQANAKAGIFVTPNASGSATITPKGNGSYTKNFNGNWSAVQTSTSSDCYVVFMGNSTDFAKPWLGANTHVKATATGGTHGFIHNVRWYRLEDEDDLLAGNLFRAAFKQQYVSENPSAIRFMNWHGNNTDLNCRWENRAKPSTASYDNDFGVAPYGDSSMGDTNQMTLTAIGTTPASMQHGEVAQFRVGSALVRADNGFQNILGVDPIGGGSTTARGHFVAHGFLVGDWIIHKTSGGMPNLNLWPVKITAVPDADHYDFANPSGSGLGTFSSGSVSPYVTMQVGTGSDRVAYPIVFLGTVPVTSVGGAGSVYVTLHSLKTIHFDKQIIGHFDGSGNPVRGVWIIQATGGDTPAPVQGIPIEICVALVNELNAMSVAQGITNPIHIWLNCPLRGMLSIDADYSSASNWAVKMTDTALNGSTVNGVTYAGLTAAANLYLEYSNEVWNNSQVTDRGFYLQQYGVSRWFALGFSANNFQDGHSLRATCMARDVKAAFPGNSRILTVMGLHGATDFAPNAFHENYYQYYANSSFGAFGIGNYYFNDATVVAQSWGRPADNLDAICIAPYLDPAFTYWETVPGTGTFTDDSAMYNGTDNSGTLTFVGGTGGVSSTTLVTTAISAGSIVVGQPLVGTGITSPATTVLSIVGVSPNLTLTLSQAATVTAGTTIKSPSNGGGNYIGAANPSQAITNFVAAVSVAFRNGGEGIADYTTPTTGYFDQYSNGILPGAWVLNYEGGSNWNPQVGAGGGIHTFTTPDTLLLIAVENSSNWATALAGISGIFNNFCTRANCRLPATYLVTNANTGAGDVGNPVWTWAYASPDTYASGIEGQGLLNNPAWAAMSARNLGINDSLSVGPSNIIAFSVMQDSSRYQTRMIGY